MLRIAVIGQGACDASLAALAHRVGAGIARRGALLVCGGLGGVMLHAAAGAREEGGLVLGLLPGDDPADANPHVTIPVATGAGEARNAMIANTADAFVAIGGAYGTLSEIAFALRRGKVVIGLQCSWQIEGMQLAHTAEEALALLPGGAGGARRGCLPEE